MDTCVHVDVKLKHKQSIRGIRKNIKLYFKTFDEIVVDDWTTNYYLSKIEPKLLGYCGLFTLSTVKPFSAVQKSGTIVLRSETKQTVTNIHLLRLEARLPSHMHPRICLTAQESL